VLCRRLRHAWPDDGGTCTETKHRGNRCTEAEIEMVCTRGCGVIRRETVEPLPGGGARRIGKPRYTYTDPDYRLKPNILPDGTRERQERIGAEELAGAALRLMYPNVNW
jgi:hypothetical protein